MRSFVTAVVIAVLASTASAQPIRFKGSAVTNTRGSAPRNQAGVIIFDGDYAGNLSLPLNELLWKFDISTDGQSVTIHDMSATYDGTIQINPLVSVDLTLKASITNKTVDINPTTSTVWKVQSHDFESIAVSGVYHGLGLTKSFAGVLPKYWLTDGQLGLLDFAAWPNSLSWNAQTVTAASTNYSNEQRAFAADSSNGWIGVEPYLHIRQVQIWEPVAVHLTAEASSSGTADINSDGFVDGADFLHWQRSGGTAQQLELWKQQFGTAPVATSIPEPTAATLAMMGIGLTALRRRK